MPPLVTKFHTPPDMVQVNMPWRGLEEGREVVVTLRLMNLYRTWSRVNAYQNCFLYTIQYCPKNEITCSSSIQISSVYLAAPCTNSGISIHECVS